MGVEPHMGVKPHMGVEFVCLFATRFQIYSNPQFT